MSDLTPLTRFRAALARPRGMKRLDALLSADDARAAVNSLSVPDLYFLIKDLGFADSAELLGLADADQVQGCLDMDVWDRDVPQLEAVKPWLETLRESGFENFGAVWSKLDPEFTALVLARSAHIYDHSLGEEPGDDVDDPIYRTVDTFFSIVVEEGSPDDCQFVFDLLDDLYRFDVIIARQALMAARGEPLAHLEEMAYRWRSGRMADLGYVDFYDALEVFRPLDPASVSIDEGTAKLAAQRGDDVRAEDHSLPVAMLEEVVGRTFLAKILDKVSGGEESERIEKELLLLVNRVLSAARVSPADENTVRVGTEHATCTLALGLEAVSGGDIDRALLGIESIALIRLHRVGYTLTLRLSRAARRLAPLAAVGDPVAAGVFAALLGPRPFFPCELDAESKTGLRPFESAQDLSTVAMYLSQVALRVGLAQALGAIPSALADAPEPRPELDDFVRTACVRALGGGDYTATALTSEEVRAAIAQLTDGRIPGAAREALANATAHALADADITTGTEHLPSLIDRWLSDIEASIGKLQADVAITPQHVGGVLLASDSS